MYAYTVRDTVRDQTAHTCANTCTYVYVRMPMCVYVCAYIQIQHTYCETSLLYTKEIKTHIYEIEPRKYDNRITAYSHVYSGSHATWQNRGRTPEASQLYYSTFFMYVRT
jgi:hypothetical protein